MAVTLAGHGVIKKHPTSSDFTPFFRALVAAGYDARVSIEGGLPPPETRVEGLRAALGILRAAHAAALASTAG